MLIRALPAALATALLLSTPATAEDTAATPNAAPMLHGVLELSLSDAIRMGLQNNLGVEVERFGPILAGLDEQIAWGAYDPEVFGEFGYEEDKTPQSNPILAGPSLSPSSARETGGFGGLRGLLPLLSTEFSAQFNGSQRRTNQQFESLSPRYDSGWELALTQPLLRDLIWNQSWTQVRTSRLSLYASQENFRTNVMNLVRNIENAYWQLIADEEKVRVAQKSLETARALLDQTETEYEVGVKSKVAVTEAQAGLAQRETELIRAENEYRNQQDALIDLVLGVGLRAASTLEIEPTDRPEEFTEFEIDIEQAVHRAFENRPELMAKRKEVERQETQTKFAWNQRLPELDAVLGFGELGLAGNPNPNSPPPAVPSQGGFNNTFDDYSDSPQFSARARFSLPIPNTQARRTYDKDRFELRRAQTELRKLEQEIILEVRTAARNLKASQDGIESAERATEAAQEQLRAERIRLEYGESTPFDVLQREEQLVDNEVDRIDAYRAYRSSATELDRAQGTILRNRNIKIEEVRALR